jgi:hypothetical protein
VRRVYVLNRGGHDYSAAEVFGEVVYCTEGNLSKWDINQMYRIAEENLLDSEPDDYIVLTSLTSLCSIYSAVFAHKHGRLNLLIFKDGGYVERTVVIGEGVACG